MDELAGSRYEALVELLRRARSAIEDGVVTEAEARDFRAFLEEHPELAATPHTMPIVRDLRHIFSTGTVPQERRDKLLALLRDISGERAHPPPEGWGEAVEDYEVLD